MRKNVKVRIAVVFALLTSLVLTSILSVPRAEAGTDAKVGNAWYTILSEDSCLAQYKKPSSKTVKEASIPDTVKIGQKTYKVTSVADNAFKNNKKLKKAVIGENVATIGKKAFYGCKNLKAVTIKTTKLEKSSVGAKAFKGLNAKAVVTVPSEKLVDYNRALVNTGLTGKIQKVKVDKFNPTEPQFDPEHCWFEIGRGTGQTSDFCLQSGKYAIGDTVPLRSRVGFNPAVYGHWEKDNRILEKGFVRCAGCMECFTDLGIAIHDVMELGCPGGCWGNYYIGNAGTSNTTWAFVPDYDPCRTVFQYTLPQGLSYKEGSLKVTDCVDQDDLTRSCDINVSGNCVTVTISDIKSNPFYYPYDYESYKKNLYYRFDSKGRRTYFRTPIVVEISAEVTSGISKENIISSTTSYSYKGVQHAKNYEATIHTSSLKVSNSDANGNSLSGAEFDLYKMKAAYEEGSNHGSSDWNLFVNGIHAGDVVSGLGAGNERMLENEYRIVQTKTPEGYQNAYPLEFELFIDENGNVSAKDEDGNALEVKDGVVQVDVVNAYKKKLNSRSASTSKNEDIIQNEPQKTESNPVNTPVTNTSSSTGSKVVKVRATYYKDGKRESSMTFQQTVESSETMMDKKEISDRAYVFKGCRLEKTTLNGAEVDSLPEKVEDKSEVCFYYVTG